MGFTKGSLVTRASAAAYNLFLALIPSLIFLFTLIPFVPIKNFQPELLAMIYDFIPESVYRVLESTIVDVVTKKSGVLLLIMFVATIVFSSNGIHALISAFNISQHSFETRTWLTQRMVSVVLVTLISVMLLSSVSLIIFSKIGINHLVKLQIIRVNITYHLLLFGRWLIVTSLLFFAVSFLYYLAPAKKTGWRFLSWGSAMATFMVIISALVFSFYVNHFGQYNKLYGSIGTLMVVLLWLYLISISLIIGFEMNVATNISRNGQNIPTDGESQ
ncbi:YihY/virulence factor BrkB family protein [bacterium]|nr:YihY/virulence factor BrkB family protein [bacterium]MBU1064325.1 YihY/virulence factor BrkB family protein [bacterium]MBU1635689.1 YihY/virulence factor BrkB family protein [bacterium]MBU1874544.1 YihY/virulence factor BrkB family protein [bacterium]